MVKGSFLPVVFFKVEVLLKKSCYQKLYLSEVMTDWFTIKSITIGKPIILVTE